MDAFLFNGTKIGPRARFVTVAQNIPRDTSVNLSFDTRSDCLASVKVSS